MMNAPGTCCIQQLHDEEHPENIVSIVRMNRQQENTSPLGHPIRFRSKNLSNDFSIQNDLCPEVFGPPNRRPLVKFSLHIGSLGLSLINPISNTHNYYDSKLSELPISEDSTTLHSFSVAVRI